MVGWHEYDENTGKSLSIKTVAIESEKQPLVTELTLYATCACCGKNKEINLKFPEGLNPHEIICDGCRYPPKQNGYHLADIEKGKYGEASKIREETAEFMDAVDQEARLMVLHELSDLYGAMRAYLEKHYPTFTIKDLEKMSDLTKRAFESGHRNAAKM